MRSGRNPMGVRVSCARCGWRGDRIAREGRGQYGGCLKCGSPVTPATQLEDRRVAKAKAELAELQRE